ncbi:MULTISPECIES: aminoglycoside phosphotransferase family protein [Actinoplanes]|uniref:aminoglycoside phosphotransferase family protein n=1 Tax=Actinoplanes TaxID=1865 RepID=UPI0005F2E709|nr:MULTISPECIES: aminoglycoside phosphotransferase family protein [Actinoplanes]GLY04471.1 aminoglycoside phosphotransferase [Actinoplanes sp. NBRC 101535]
MSDLPDWGPAPQRVEVGADQVRRLVAAQFPQWAGLPVTPVARGGWDNRTFHLGDGMSVRLPSAAQYARAVEKEHRWLPVFAERLPQPIPVPLAQGVPGEGYPFAWSVYGWLAGETASVERIADPVRFAGDLAEFVAAIRGFDPSGGPGPGLHNWFRGATLRAFDGFAQDGLTALDGRIDTDLAARVWADCLAAPWDGRVTWFHGDLAPGNLLLRDGELGAVIDFGTCGVGDPSCDLAVAWTLLTADGREVFRKRLGVDDAEWTRGRGWALWKTLQICASDGSGPGAWRALSSILDDYR